MGVAVRNCDLNDLVDPLDLLFLPRAHVVLDAVHGVHVFDATKLRRKTTWVNDRILLRKQYACGLDAHALKNVERLFAHRSTTDDKALDVVDGERLEPFVCCVAELSGLPLVVQHYSNSL